MIVHGEDIHVFLGMDGLTLKTFDARLTHQTCIHMLLVIVMHAAGYAASGTRIYEYPVT